MESSLFESLIRVLVQYRGRFFLGFIMLVISNTLLILNPLVFRQAVMAVDPNSPPEAGILHDFFCGFGVIKWAMSSFGLPPY